MPDITMCDLRDCPKCGTCYRYMAVPWNQGQCWFTDDPREPDGTCTYYWPSGGAK